MGEVEIGTVTNFLSELEDCFSSDIIRGEDMIWVQRKIRHGIVALLVLISVVGCATIMHGANQDVGISSTPSGALITVNNVSHGTTPTITKLKREDNHIVRIELEGYQPFEATLTKSVSGWVWGNIVFGGLIGLAVDAISGGIYNLSPEQLTATLSKTDVAFVPKKDTLYVTLVREPEASWKRISTLTQ